MGSLSHKQKKTGVFLFFFAVIVIFSADARAYEEVPPGPIQNCAATWGPGTVYVTGSVTVSDDCTLTIASGTVVKFAPATQLYINGTLFAVGVATDDIVITSRDDDAYGEKISGSDGTPAAGDWGGIYTNGNSQAEGIANFAFVRIRYGGDPAGSSDANVLFYYSDSGYFVNSISEFSGDRGVRIAHASPEITDCHIQFNASHGLYVEGTGMPLISDNVFTDNGEYAVYVSWSLVSPLSANNSGSGNGINGFGISGPVTADQTWAYGSPGFPIVVANTLSVYDNVTLTVPAGQVIKFSPGTQLNIYGTLDAVGLAPDDIVFTSLADDEYGGDTTGDGAATLPSRGDWRGIYTNGNSQAEGIANFAFVRIRYGGDPAGSSDANVLFYYSDSGYFVNSISEFSGDRGVRIAHASPEITDCHIQFNASHGLYVEGTGMPLISDNVFTDNGEYAVYVSWSLVSPLSANNSGSGNGINGFGISGPVTADQTWAYGSPGFPIVVANTLSVNYNATLTIPAGQVIKFSPGTQLNVYGTLNAVGSMPDDIVFTSLADDEYGGDTTGDGAATLPSRGDWGAIFLNSYGTAQGIGNFAFVRIRYGGDPDGSPDANICYYYPDSGYFVHSISEFSETDGLVFLYTSLSVVNATISNNDGNGISCSYSSPGITNTIIWGNSLEAIYTSTSDTPVVAYSIVEDGYSGEGNLDKDPLFLGGAIGDYRLDICSPAIDAGDPIERLVVEYTAGQKMVQVDAVTQVHSGDTIWITDGTLTEMDEVSAITADSIELVNGFSSSYPATDNVYLYTSSSDYHDEPLPNGRHINMGAYGGSSEAAVTPEKPIVDVLSFDGCITETQTATIDIQTTDPGGGVLTYDWQALDGGVIEGEGDNVTFSPEVGANPHPCPYRVQLRLTSSELICPTEKIFEINVKLRGDVNADGVVNILDKVAVRNAFGESGDPCWITADVDCNGVVNILDKVIVRNQFGQSGCACP